MSLAKNVNVYILPQRGNKRFWVWEVWVLRDKESERVTSSESSFFIEMRVQIPLYISPLFRKSRKNICSIFFANKRNGKGFSCSPSGVERMETRKWFTKWIAREPYRLTSRTGGEGAEEAKFGNHFGQENFQSINVSSKNKWFLLTLVVRLFWSEMDMRFENACLSLHSWLRNVASARQTWEHVFPSF